MPVSQVQPASRDLLETRDQPELQEAPGQPEEQGQRVRLALLEAQGQLGPLAQRVFKAHQAQMVTTGV